MPYLDIITRVKEVALNVSQAQADELRWKVRQTLERAKLPRSNITKLERLANGSLQRNENIIILPADKGNSTAVMDKMDYTKKLEDLISNGSYSKEKKDPTTKMECKLSQILIKNKDHFAPKMYRQLLQHYTKLPHIYGLPKIRKDGIPLRPIVSCQGSVCHPLSCFLVDIIEPLVRKSPSCPKLIPLCGNNQRYSHPIQPDGELGRGEFVHQGPTEEALSVVRDRLASDSSLQDRTSIPIDNLMEMLTFCTQTTHFGIGSCIY